MGKTQNYLAFLLAVCFAFVLRPTAKAQDRTLEDKLANLFVSIRAKAKQPPMTRIKWDRDLQQAVCTSALEGRSFYNIYDTEDPLAVSTQLQRAATDKHPSQVRYAIAVWPDPQSLGQGHRRYWIGIWTYTSAFSAWVDAHLTDEVSYRRDFRKSIAPACRKIKAEKFH